MKYFLVSLFILFAASNSLAEDSLKIGVLASMSDEWAALGDATVKGAKLAISEINGAGGIHGRQLELVVEDTQEANSGARAISAFRSLRQRGIQWFIGPSGTPAGMSLAPIVRSELVVIITPTVGVRTFSDAGPNVFNSRGIDEDASAEMARVAFQRGWKLAAVLSSQQPWELAQGNAFRREFERLGGKIIAHEAPLPETNDFRAILTKLLSTKPQAFFLSNYNRMAVAAKQLFELGYTGPKLTTVLDNSIVKASQSTLNDAEFASFVGPTDDFRKRFQIVYGSEPDFGADTAYDGVIALARALRAGPNLNPSDISEKLVTITFEGASGPFAFNSDRIAQRKLKRFAVKAGHIEEILG